MLVEANLGSDENYKAAQEEGLGIFLRTLVGLDRQAAIKAFDAFIQGKALNANQQEFIAMLVEELTRTGVMQPERLFESPFVDVAPAGVQALFGADGASQLTRILEDIRRTAIEPITA